MDDKAIERERIQRDSMLENWDRVKAAVLPEFSILKKQLPDVLARHTFAHPAYPQTNFSGDDSSSHYELERG